MSSQTIIDCRHVVFKRGARTYLDDINFELPAGSLMGLIGHNGAGKSTLLKIVLGLLKPFSGSITVLGKAAGTQPLQVGYLPENVSFYNHMTAAEHLAYFAGLKHVAKSRVDDLVEELGLAEVLHQKMGLCSKGQRQRLGLAQALLTRPKLLILDEPTVGLDPAASLLMYREVSELTRSGCSVMVCTHELALVEPYLHAALVMNRGKLAGCGTIDQLRRSAQLPVTISRAPLAIIERDARLSVWLHGAQLAVPEDQVKSVVGILTREYGCFDFEVRKADLGSIFRHFVDNAGTQEGRA